MNEKTINISEKSKALYLNSLARQIQVLREAMELNAYDKACEVSQRIYGSAALFNMKELGDACQWMEKVCLEQRSDAMVQAFQVIEVIVSRYVNLWDSKIPA